MASDPGKRILAVGMWNDTDGHRDEITSRLKTSNDTDQVIFRTAKAKPFFDTELSIKTLTEVFPDEEDPFEEVKPIQASQPTGEQ